MTEDIEILRRRIGELEDRVQELEDALGMSLPVPSGFRGRPLVWRLICCLARRGTLTREQAMIMLYGDRSPDERPYDKIIDVLLVHARRWLDKHGIAIMNIWGHGWSLSSHDRARAKALVGLLQAADAPS